MKKKGVRSKGSPATRSHSSKPSSQGRRNPPASSTRSPGTRRKTNYDSIRTALQDFCKTLAMTAQDSLPTKSNYRELLIKVQQQDIAVWNVLQREIASQVSAWPEWGAILQAQQHAGSSSNKTRASRIKRYGHSVPVKVPTHFTAFDNRFRNTAAHLLQKARKYIREGVSYSLERFAQQPDYQQSARSLQKLVSLERLRKLPDALPLLDALQPTQLTSEIITTLFESLQQDIDSISKMSYPYQGSRPCNWNLALMLRMQVQFKNAYRHKFSQLLAAAQAHFYDLFYDEILQSEILPRLRALTNNSNFCQQLVC